MKRILAFILFVLGLPAIRAQVVIYPIKTLGWNFWADISKSLEKERPDSGFLNKTYDGYIDYSFLIKNNNNDTVEIETISSDARTICNCNTKTIHPKQYLLVKCLKRISYSIVLSETYKSVLLPQIDLICLPTNISIDFKSKKNDGSSHGFYQRLETGYYRQSGLLDSVFSGQRKPYKKDTSNRFKLISDSLMGNYISNENRHKYNVEFKFICQNVTSSPVLIDSIQLDGKTIRVKDILLPDWATIGRHIFTSNQRQYGLKKRSSVVKIYYMLPNGEAFLCSKKINFIR